jgi:hypothetical protein
VEIKEKTMGRTSSLPFLRDLRRKSNMAMKGTTFVPEMPYLNISESQ